MEHRKTEDADVAERLDRAVDRFAAAVEEFARQVERMSPPEPLDEEEAVRLAQEGVREVRREMREERAKEPRHPAPTPEEVREWERRRDERIRGEGRRPL
ncbi:MAG: hypothetical protein H0U65_02955 [Rubrobacter sp.]|jgi:hypothetical protein|nr:hypothetical protein [Rubrobacter sp.]